MLLAIDIGNTQTKFGLFKESEAFEMLFHYPTKSLLSESCDDLSTKLGALGDVKQIGIASVVPEANQVLVKMVQEIHPNAKVKIVGNADTPFIKNHYEPSQIGIDRLLGAYSAYHRWGKSAKKPVIVISFGTATTIDFVSKKGEYLGGMITLGIASTAKALASTTSLLPEVELQFPPHLIGRSTVESIQSGILFGAVAMIDGIVAKIQTEAFDAEAPIVIATGGLAHIFDNRTKSITHIAPHLLIVGIAQLMKDGK
ncbi:MAG: type III pantothenate kinase [bacterium]